MKDSQRKVIEQIVNTALSRAEFHWEHGGYKIEEASRAGVESTNNNDTINMSKSSFPGYPIITEYETIISEFVAFVADMRDSTQHLMQAISTKKAKVSQLQRVFYETSALLPAIAKTIEFHKGKVTEYLGDGVLGFFKVEECNRKDAMYSSSKAAKDVLEETCPIVNNILHSKYNLPSLEIGIGLAMSKAIVSLTGLPDNPHPKAFGECVFRATKLSVGKNIICVDERMRKHWPSSPNGKVSFKETNLTVGNNIKGYIMEYKG